MRYYPEFPYAIGQTLFCPSIDANVLISKIARDSFGDQIFHAYNFHDRQCSTRAYDQYLLRGTELKPI